MQNFNQLLNQYIQRAGISDSELARTIGVSRQTIFRWREGATSRPRHRDDVLAIARKLRLTPEERDTLLLAAGFRPEVASLDAETQKAHPEVEIANRADVEQLVLGSEASEVDQALPRRVTKLPQWVLWSGGTIIVLLLISGIGWWVNQRQIDNEADITPISTTVRPTPPPAAEGESLVLITDFANYANSSIGYNVAGRLAEELQQEVNTIEMDNIRVAIWPNIVGDRNLALQTGQASNATLVIFGEYDVGRVVVKMAHPGNQNILSDPALQQHVADLQELSATINSSLPKQVRSLALLALGQIFLNQREPEQAQPLLIQARDNLQADASVDEKTWGVVNFYLGIAYQRSNPANLKGAIAAYSEAIEAWPTMISSRLNRGAAYEARKLPGDLERALKDAEAVIAIAPDWASGYNNRASIRLNMGGDENLEMALDDLEKTLDLDPDLPEAYINQAYIYLRQGRSMAEIEPVLQHALQLRSNYATALNILCWGYALEQQPEVGLPYCQQAIDVDPRPIFHDSRGLTYALLENYPAAIADFEIYTAWLEKDQPGNTWQRDLGRRRAWIDHLKADKNPFTPQLLAELQSESGQ